MNREAIINAPVLAHASPPQIERLRKLLPLAGIALMVLTLVLAAWLVRTGAPYNAGKGAGYALGLAGGLLLLGLLVYPVRKRVRFMHGWGALKYWFQFHMVGGIFGPVLILFHSTFHVGSFNAAVALACMLLVVASGVVGRFIYRKIHHGLYGTQASLKELEQAMAREFEALAPALHRMPLVKQELEHFAALVSLRPAGRFARVAYFLSLGPRRVFAAQRLRRALSEYAPAETKRQAAPDSLSGLLLTIDSALRAAQRRAQFSGYERLFSLWHVIHVPFLCMLVITALVHVVAVHVY